MKSTWLWRPSSCDVESRTSTPKLFFSDGADIPLELRRGLADDTTMLVERMASPATRHEWDQVKPVKKVNSGERVSQAKHTTAADHHGHGEIEHASLDQFVGEGEWTCQDVDDEAPESDTARLEMRIADRDTGIP